MTAIVVGFAMLVIGLKMNGKNNKILDAVVGGAALVALFVVGLLALVIIIASGQGGDSGYTRYSNTVEPVYTGENYYQQYHIDPPDIRGMDQDLDNDGIPNRADIDHYNTNP